MNWFARRKEREEDLERELDGHLELETEEQREAGRSAADARFRARRALGNPGLIREWTREAWGWVWLEQLGRDLRYGGRLFLKNPGFTVVAVLTLALGIGANTAIFSLVDGLMRKPLPYPEPERLVKPATVFPRYKTDRGSVAYADILDWKAQTGVFEAVAAYNVGSVDVTGGEEPERLRGLIADRDYFRVMRSAPALGRYFTAEEDLPKANRVVVLSHGLWMRRFGGDPKVLGSTVELSGIPHTIVGVAPKYSTWPEEAELFRPLGIGPAPSPNDLRRDNHVYQAIARLKPGVTVEQAQAQLTVIGARVASENTNRAGTNWKVHRLNEWILGPALRQTLLVLLGAVLFVLLIACVNVANLLLARGAVRAREVAVRSALGAGWTRLARQFLAESALLAVAGGLAGVAVGYWGLKGLIRFAPPGVPRLDEVHIDATVLGFTALLSVVTALVTGIMPAINAARVAPVESFHEAGRGSAGGQRGTRLRSVLVVAELALAIVLLAGAGLLVRSLGRLQHVDPGFPSKNLLTMEISLPRARYQGPGEVTVAFREIVDEIRRIPGVASAAGTSSLPLGGGGFYLGRVFLKEGQTEPPATKDARGAWSVIQPEYFRTMGIPILRGRAFTDRDLKDSTPVIVISKSMADEMFPNESPLGRRIRSWRDENLYREIVGVAGDLRYWGLSEDIVNNVYVPHTQNAWNTLVLTVRTQGEPRAALRSIRAAIWSHDAKLSISEVKTIDEIVDQGLARPRFSMFLLSIFALTALVLAAIGIYGVVSYSVAQRTREIGIRMALGALRGDVLRMVAARAAILAGAGVLCGLAGALAVTRLMRTLLFGVKPTDAETFFAVGGLLLAVAMAAAVIPARRASRVDPTVTLRYE